MTIKSLTTTFRRQNVHWNIATTTVSEYLSVTQFNIFFNFHHSISLNPMHNKSFNNIFRWIKCLWSERVRNNKNWKWQWILCDRDQGDKFISILIHVWWLVWKLLNRESHCNDAVVFDFFIEILLARRFYRVWHELLMLAVHMSITTALSWVIKKSNDGDS